MARETLLRCDACGKKNGGNLVVTSMDGRRSDGHVLTVDLCKSCWGRLERDYGFRELQRVPRKGYHVLDSASQIPTSGA